MQEIVMLFGLRNSGLLKEVVMEKRCSDKWKSVWSEIVDLGKCVWHCNVKKANPKHSMMLSSPKGLYKIIPVCSYGDVCEKEISF